MTKGKVYTHDKQRHAGSNAVILSPDERRAQGKALRDAAPREAQGGWKPPRTRRDRVQMLIESNEGRLAELMPIHFGRMLQSPFAFYRGAAAIMAADLATTPSSGVRVQACGDAHLLNFGGFATPERQIVFDINDLDETLPALWEWDLKRLTASMVIAAHHLRLSESEAARAATATVHAYRERMADYSSARALESGTTGSASTACSPKHRPTRSAIASRSDSRRRASRALPNTSSPSSSNSMVPFPASRTVRR